jgi:hypothetical protein
MKEWFTLMELAAAKLPDMPTSKRGLQLYALREGWQSHAGKVRDAGQRGGGFE